MFPSPLILDRHFFSKVEVNSHVDGQVETPNLLNCQLELGQSADDQKLFQLVLKLKILSPPDKKTTYTGEIHAVGLFRVVENWPQADKQNLVESYGASVLFAAIRELLMNITFRGPWPPVLLSTFSFIKPKEAPVETSAKEPQAAKV
jgi:preprotein translocase subunit SecB